MHYLKRRTSKIDSEESILSVHGIAEALRSLAMIFPEYISHGLIDYKTRERLSNPPKMSIVLGHIDFHFRSQ